MRTLGDARTSLARYDTVVLVSLLRVLVVIVGVIVGFGGVGCVHVVTIQTDPTGGVVTVDNEVIGNAPVQVKKAVFFGDQLRVAVEQEGYEPASVSVAASEWFVWPGLFSVVPLLGLPVSLPVLFIPIAGPFIAAAVVVGWGVVTSPALLSLALIRKYPDTVTVPLTRRRTDVLTPADFFPPADDLGPNPLPLDSTPTEDETKRKPYPKPPPGANPVP